MRVLTDLVPVPYDRRSNLCCNRWGVGWRRPTLREKEGTSRSRVTPRAMAPDGEGEGLCKQEGEGLRRSTTTRMELTAAPCDCGGTVREKRV
jgi:hypothetical protein